MPESSTDGCAKWFSVYCSLLIWAVSWIYSPLVYVKSDHWWAKTGTHKELTEKSGNAEQDHSRYHWLHCDACIIMNVPRMFHQFMWLAQPCALQADKAERSHAKQPTSGCLKLRTRMHVPPNVGFAGLSVYLCSMQNIASRSRIMISCESWDHNTTRTEKEGHRANLSWRVSTIKHQDKEEHTNTPIGIQHLY